MGWRERLFATDEELGKRDDDHKPSSRVIPWTPRQSPFFRKRRIFGLIVGCFLLWVFVHNIPVLGPAKYRRNPYASIEDSGLLRTQPSAIVPLQESRPQESRPTSSTIKASSTPTEDVTHNFDGPVRFYYLASSLHGIARTMGHRSTNKNVLFAAADLKSVARLLPLACEMATWNRNFVHFAIMGRDEMSLDEIQNINGVTASTCDIFWHDARPDYAPYSSDSRMEISVAGALGHIENFMHPQAVLTDGFENENVFFGRAIQRKTEALDQTHIEVVDSEELSWLTRLEAESLRAWHSATIDIVIQAPKDASGSIIRLLKSLEKAHYLGFSAPRLTIELPAKVRQDTLDFLEGFEWPPSAYKANSKANELVLRRRIPDRHVTIDQASIQFVETFYPANPDDSHVFVLDPQAELSPVYFYYLKYYLLEYRYSRASQDSKYELFGISADLPTVHLNGTSRFEPPQPLSRVHQTTGMDDSKGLISTFLWQAPNSHAALYFGDKWREFHSFLSKRHAATLKEPISEIQRSRRKIVSEQHPAWTEFALELMRARGYYVLYSNLHSTISMGRSDSLVITHNDLYQPPEEFSHPPNTSSSDLALPTASILEAGAYYLSSRNLHQPDSQFHVNSEMPLVQNFNVLLPSVPSPRSRSDGQLKNDATPIKPLPPSPDLPLLPLIDHDGLPVDAAEFLERALTFAADYRTNMGGCDSRQADEKSESIFEESADDLFCVDDDEYSPNLHSSFEPEIPSRKSGSRENKVTASVQESTRIKTDSSSMSSTNAAAAILNAIRDTTLSRETAKPSIEPTVKLEDESTPRPATEPNEKKLNDVQRAELNDWKAKQRKAGEDVADSRGVAKAGEAKAVDGRAKAVKGPSGEGRAVAGNTLKAQSKEEVDSGRGNSISRGDVGAEPQRAGPGGKQARIIGQDQTAEPKREEVRKKQDEVVEDNKVNRKEAEKLKNTQPDVSKQQRLPPRPPAPREAG